MDTRFIIPASVAVAVHALAFLYPKSPAAGRVVAPRDDPPVYVLMDMTMSPEPLPVKSEDAQTAAAGQPDDTPRAPEPALKPDGDFYPPPRPPSPNPRSDLKKIPLGPVGIPGVNPGVGIGPGIFDSVSLDSKPRTRVQVAPVYPTEAKSRGLTAEVVVGFIVDEQGRVTAEHVVRSSDAMFEEATLQAVRKWRFEPGKKDGRAVKFRLQVPVVFNLNE